MSGVPGPARRLLRNRPRLVAVALLAVTVLAASVLQSTAAAVLQQTLDENWRGAYDILVTQAGRSPDVNGFVRSDALTDATTGRLSLADLENIRSLPGVDVAAPIAEVAFADASLTGEPVVWLPVPVRADASLESPQAFRITVTGTTSDGLGERDLATESVLAFAYQPSFSQIVFDATGAPLLDDTGDFVYATVELADSPRLLTADTRLPFIAGTWDPVTGTIPLGLVVAPRPVARIALVDPVAEREMLGEAGAFLDPLIDALRNNEPGDGDPLVILTRPSPVVSVSVTVEEYDEVLPGAAGAEAVEQAQGTGFLQNGQLAPQIIDDAATHLVSSFDVDTRSLYDAFEQSPELLGGIDQGQVAATAEQLRNPAATPRSIVAGRYTFSEADDGGDLQIALQPRGYATFGQYTEAPLSGSAPAGAVTMYSKLFGSVGTGQFDRGPVEFDVVGQYSVDELRTSLGEVNFMPLGSYDIAAPSLQSGDAVATSTTGFGVPGTNQLAIGSFDLLEGWNVERPISAIRIRVIGSEGYGPEAQQRLLQAASALNNLGYTATIVAGSSPQSVSVLVEAYALDELAADGGQVIGELGTIQQSWSRLGAVVEADVGVSATGIALLAVSIVSVGVLMAVVQLGSVPARRVQAGVLRQFGWRRGRIARWLLAEEALALAIAAAVGVIAVAIARVREVAAVSVGLSLMLVVITSLVAVGLGARAPRHPPHRQRVRQSSAPPRVTGPRSFGMRQARVNSANSASLGLAMLFIVLAVSVGAMLAVQGRDIAGPSELAALAATRAWVPQGLLAGATLVAGIALAVLSRRMGVDRRAEQWAAIRAMGWTGADVLRAHFAELTVSAVPGVILGLGFATALTLAQAPAAFPLVMLIGSGCGVLALAVVLVGAVQRSGGR